MLGELKLIGRDRELKELLDGLAVTREGHGQIYLISGEPGIGKTRLMTEFGAHAGKMDTRVCWGRSWNDGGISSFWPWRQIFRQCLKDDLAYHVVASLGDCAHDLASAVPEIQVSSKDSEHHAPLPAAGELARLRIFGEVCGT